MANRAGRALPVPEPSWADDAGREDVSGGWSTAGRVQPASSRPASAAAAARRQMLRFRCMGAGLLFGTDSDTGDCYTG